MKTKISKEQIKTEFQESLELIRHYLDLIKKGKEPFRKPLSVELRKLFCEGEGDMLLKRIERIFRIEIKFHVRIEPRIPPRYKEASIDAYINEFRCFLEDGKEYSRKEIIKMIADKKGAHLDEKEEKFHQIERRIFLPVSNLNKEEIYPLATKYLIDIANSTLNVCYPTLNKLI